MNPEESETKIRVQQLRQQYGYVKESRQILQEFCMKLSAEDFIRPSSTLNNKSVRDLFVHTANTYQFWIGKYGLQQDMTYTESQEIPDCSALRSLFGLIDRMMEAFLLRMENPAFAAVEIKIGQATQRTEPLRLFSHVITHEYHHKGQILSISRIMGYTPVDTDIMR